jgi:deoxycytidylate deaminase
MPEGKKADVRSTLVGLEFPEAELVFARTYPVGTDYSGVLLTLNNYIKRFGYRPQEIRLSEQIANIATKVDLPGVELRDEPEAKRINSYMDGGNKIRELTRCPDFVTAAAVAEIGRRRHRDLQGLGEPANKTVHILNSLKRPEEVGTLRKIYGLGFYLIGIFSSQSERLDYLTGDKNIPRSDALKLMKRDEDEASLFGQRTRDTFQLADVFVKLSDDAYKKQLERFLDLVFGFPYDTPEPDEYSMFLAYSAALRSGQLARQVGASIRSKTGDIVALGCNDVPSPGGGLYWPGAEDARDYIRRYDSNDVQLRRIIEDVVSKLGDSIPEPKRVADLLKGSLLYDVSEFGRAVHAEMDALFTCARNGTSPVGAELFTTTFPCHNCTRHIITAGIRRVVYIEPYPKSMAAKLHKDAVILGMRKNANDPRISFEAFVGIGPRRFFDLFSLKLSRGSDVRRKENGRVLRFDRGRSTPRIQMLPSSYLMREQLAADNVRIGIDDLLKQKRLL